MSLHDIACSNAAPSGNLVRTRKMLVACRDKHSFASDSDDSSSDAGALQLPEQHQHAAAARSEGHGSISLLVVLWWPRFPHCGFTCDQQECRHEVMIFCVPQQSWYHISCFVDACGDGHHMELGCKTITTALMQGASYLGNCSACRPATKHAA